MYFLRVKTKQQNRDKWNAKYYAKFNVKAELNYGLQNKKNANKKSHISIFKLLWIMFGRENEKKVL